jgi:hypothetical protein
MNRFGTAGWSRKTPQPPPPAKPTPRISNRPDLAPLRPIDHLDGHMRNLFPGQNKSDQQFRLDLEMPRSNIKLGQHRIFHQPKSALRIRQPPARPTRNPPAHPPIHHAPHPGHPHRIVHAISYDHSHAAFFGALQKPRNITRSMLPISVHGQNPGKPFRNSLIHAGQKSGAFALRNRMPKHLRTRPRCLRPRFVPRSIIHHKNLRQKPAGAPHHRGNGFPLVQAWNHHRALTSPIHSFPNAKHPPTLAQIHLAIQPRRIREQRPPPSFGKLKLLNLFQAISLRRFFANSAEICYATSNGSP